MGAIPRLDDLKTAELHDTAIARAARAEIARRAARLSERPPTVRQPLNIRPANEVAIERLVFQICHFTLAPLRLVSAFVSAERRRRGVG